MTSPVTLADAVRQSALYQLGNIHTALPASIISYDYKVQKASVQPLLNKVWSDGTTTPMPVLENVPVIFPRAGGASLTFPVVRGDTCLLIFIERSIDLWLSQGGQVNPDDPRKFSLSDAVAIPGLYPFSESSPAENNTDLFLQYANSYFKIKESGDVVINTAGTVAIGNSLVELLDVVSQILGFLGSPTAVTPISLGTPQPFNFELAAVALKAQLDLIKGTIP